MSIAIVTDSTSDIPSELAKQYHIHIVPAILVIDGKSYEDGIGITRKELYERLPHMDTPPTTATPSAGTFQKLYEKLFKDGYQSIISIHVASLLSGIYNTAQIAAQTFNNKVWVIDSHQLSAGLGFQVLAAAEAVTKGDSLKKVLSVIENVRLRIKVVAMLDTLEYVRRSGRVSWAKARIGSLLDIKPFLEVKEGQIINLGQARTRRKGINHLIELCHRVGDVEKLAVLHTNAEDEAQQMLNQLKDIYSESPLVINVTTIVGTHVGPNGLGFAVVKK